MQYHLERKLSLISTALASAALLAACGGGSGGSDNASTGGTSVMPAGAASAAASDAGSTATQADTPASAASEVSSSSAAAASAPAGGQAASGSLPLPSTTAGSTGHNTSAAAATGAGKSDTSSSTTQNSTPSSGQGTPATTPSVAIVVPSTTLPSTPSAATTEKVTTPATQQVNANANVSVWTSPEKYTVKGIVSGDGVSVTASRVQELSQRSYGITYGFRTAKEDWAGLAARYARETSIINSIKAESARVDSWILRKFERADLVGGWGHDLIDPITGVPVTWTPTLPEPADGSTTQAIKYKAAWVAWGRSYNIAQMQTAARLYRLTGETKYAQWAASQLDLYAANYEKWPLQTLIGRARMFAQGLDEATNAFAMLDAVRLLKSYATNSQYTTWQNKLFLPMSENLKYPLTLKNNIALWQKSAMAAIAMRYSNAPLLEEALKGSAGIRAILKGSVTADNMWIEGSFDYNGYVIKALSELLIKASLEGYDSTFADEKETALKLLLAPIDYAFDNNTLPNPSDSMTTLTPVSVTAHWQMVRVVPTYWGLLRANSVRNWDWMLDTPAAVGDPEPLLPVATTRNFPSLRQAVLRAGDWQAYVHYGQMDANHYQEEMLNFELHRGKTPISVDAGTVSYGSPYSQDYFRKGPGNNVPLINGVGQPKIAAGNIVSFNATENRLIVEQPSYQTDAKVTRGYRVTSGGFAEQSRITITNGASKRLGVTFNSKCAISPGSGLTRVSSPPALPGVAAFGYWKNVIGYTGAAQWQAELNCAGQRFRFSVKGPSGQNVYIGKVPDVPLPAERQGIYYEVNANDVQFESEIVALD